jgi:3-phosphoshikimate 1-carboxyvinyltransferase
LDRIELSKARVFKGEFTPPPDKSISHRAVILASLANGKSLVKNILRAEDTESTINAFRSLGIEIVDKDADLVIFGKGLHGLTEPSRVIDCGNSGTTMRLVSGVLAGNEFTSVLTGDSSLQKRPMSRIIEPLTLMGAEISARDHNRYPPLTIQGKKLSTITYSMPIASAQVKSSLLLAGLYADGFTHITEPIQSRDHTEKMLGAAGIDIQIKGLTITVKGGMELSPMDMDVPGDFSSAAFFLVAALLIPGADLTLKHVGINPTRTGLLPILKSMGADIEIANRNTVSGEPVADIHCKGASELKAVQITHEHIPSMIDEFPVLCVAASLAEGITTIRGAEELRVKESDRIRSMAEEMRKFGVAIEEFPDGISITGTGTLSAASVSSHGDHRIAMSMAVAALVAEGTTLIENTSAVDISFPGFFDAIRRLTA